MLIQMHNVTKKYDKKTVLESLNLSIPKGSLVAYLGTNGAGKSTTIGLLTGLLEPTSGEIIRQPDLKIGIVFQESVLDAELSVLANLKNRAGLYRAIDRAWFEQLIELTGLTAFLKQRYGTLSGGQRRRVDIARALLSQPDLLFLDEPTTGLDIQTRQMIWALLHRLKKEQGLTIFLTTHYLEEAEHAEMTYVLDQGRILAQGAASELIATYSASQLFFRCDEKTLLSALPFPMVEEEGGYRVCGLSSQEVVVFLGSLGTHLREFEYRPGTINDAFIVITGKEME